MATSGDSLIDRPVPGGPGSRGASSRRRRCPDPFFAPTGRGATEAVDGFRRNGWTKCVEISTHLCDPSPTHPNAPQHEFVGQPATPHASGCVSALASPGQPPRRNPLSYPDEWPSRKYRATSSFQTKNVCATTENISRERGASTEKTFSRRPTFPASWSFLPWRS